MDTPKPGDFPIGSVESRAAMRLQLSNQTAEPRVEFISYIPRPWRGEGPEPENWNKVPRVSDRDGWGDKTRCLYVPPNMTEEEARKIVGWGAADRGLGTTTVTFGLGARKIAEEH